MKKISGLFLAFLSFVESLALFRRMWNPIAKAILRVDPLDNIGLFFSPLRRVVMQTRYRVGSPALLGLALLAFAALPGHAMPVWANHGAVQSYNLLGRTGFVGFSLAGAAGIAGAQQQAKIPFRYGTVRRRINIGSFTLTPGTQLPAVLVPQVGMLSRILFDIEGSYTVATAPLVVANVDGFDAIFARAQVTLNNGSANIVDLSGIGVNAINQNLNTALPIKRGTPAGVGNVNGTQMPLALGASTFSYKGILPVNANQRRQFEMGLINLQAPELRATVLLSFNPLASLFTVPANCTLFAATCNLSYEYFEIPDLRKYDLPPLTLVRSIEEAPIAIAATGQQIYQIPRLGTMIEYHAVLVLKLLYGSANTAITEFDIRYNKTDQQYQVLEGEWETNEAELYGVGINVLQAPTPSAATPTSRWQQQTSAITFNLWAASDATINGGDFRDAIDTEENTTTESIVTIKAGTTLNAGKDNLFHVRRVVQRIVPAPAPRAA
jgi:hypothetical protein